MIDHLVTLFVFIFILLVSYMLHSRLEFTDKNGIPWFRWFNLMFFIVTTMFFLAFFYLNINVETQALCAGDDIELTSNTPNSYFILDNSRTAIGDVFQASPLTVKQIEYGEFCFDYNNTDNGNDVLLVVGDDIEPILTHINNNTAGEACLSIPTNLTVNNVILGLVCTDCSASNELGIGIDTLSSDVATLFSVQPNTIVWETVIAKPATWKVNLYKNCSTTIKSMMGYYLTMLSSLIFIFIGIYIFRKISEFFD